MEFVLYRGSIVETGAEAIVNAANSQLRRGGGVCGAIFRAAGPRLDAYCDGLGVTVPAGESVVTPSFDLAQKGTRLILHAVGPVYAGHDPAGAARLLAAAYSSCLEKVAADPFASIAFPLISTGIYGYPLAEAAAIAVRSLVRQEGLTAAQRDAVARHLRRILLTAFDDAAVMALREAFAAEGLAGALKEE